jgi:hypothetical protein
MGAARRGRGRVAAASPEGSVRQWCAEQFNARWDEQMAEYERRHPGIHDRSYVYLNAKYPGHGVDGDEFYGEEEPSEGSATE